MMKKDLYLRLIIVLFMMLGSAIFVSTALTLPAYFMSMVKNNSINTSLALQESTLISFTDKKVESTQKELDRKISLVKNTEGNKNIFSQKIINEVVLDKTSSIKITEINYKEDLKNGNKIEVRGRAKNRETLLAFRRILEDNAAFSKVDLPISNFIKDTNIMFSLILTSL